MLACLMHEKLHKLACARTVTCNFGMYTQASEHMRHKKDACHEVALRLPHYTCDVAANMVAVGNEM